MTPIDQILFGHGKGDCLRACVASILDLNLDQVPNFAEDGSYLAGVVKWLNFKSIDCLRIDWTSDSSSCNQFFTTGRKVYCLLCGLSPRQPDVNVRARHAVVGHSTGWGFEMDHDPHPDRTGIVGPPESIVFIFK